MNAAADKNNSTASVSEFDSPCWSVLSFDKCEKHGLSHQEAEKFIKEMANKISGLCIVTDEAASRLQQSKSKQPARYEERSEDADKHFTEIL